jgi:chitodextrinase
VRGNIERLRGKSVADREVSRSQGLALCAALFGHELEAPILEPRHEAHDRTMSLFHAGAAFCSGLCAASVSAPVSAAPQDRSSEPRAIESQTASVPFDRAREQRTVPISEYSALSYCAEEDSSIWVRGQSSRPGSDSRVRRTSRTSARTRRAISP